MVGLHHQSMTGLRGDVSGFGWSISSVHDCGFQGDLSGLDGLYPQFMTVVYRGLCQDLDSRSISSVRGCGFQGAVSGFGC